MEFWMLQALTLETQGLIKEKNKKKSERNVRLEKGLLHVGFT